MLKDVAVRRVKPLLSDTAWAAVKGAADTVAEWDPRPGRRTQRAERRAAELAAAERSARSLTDWAVEFKTDKWGRHRYTPHYEHHLGHLRNEAFTLFEIGIGGYSRQNAGGASLRMWKAYFPKARIVGLDIEDKSFVVEPRITAYQGSQTDAELLRRIVDQTRNLQVIIDDGSHRSEHIIETFGILFPLLPLGGIYVIEDTQTSYWSRYGGTTDPAAPTTMNFVKDLLDGLNYEEFTPQTHEPTMSQRYVVAVHAYHNLIVLEKGLNEEGSKNRPKR